jgi:cobaltochelatase CobT
MDEYLLAELSAGESEMLRVIKRSGYNGWGKDARHIQSESKMALDAVRKINSGTVEGFAAQVRRLLQIRARSRFEYGQKKGKLDQSRLARIGMRDAPGFNERIFKNKIINDTTDTAVTVLLDASGSMHGNKWAHAIKSAELINATVSRALGIPLEILAFTDDETGTIIYEAKRFNQLRLGDEELLQRLGYASAYMSGNADGEAVLYAYNRLRQRREKRKVLIVVSDGAPSCSREGDIDEFTKVVIKEIEADRHVDIYGLGLMSTSVRRYYKHHVVVNHGDSLEQSLLTLIDKSIA